jgi:hypothetical protein
LKPYRKIFRPFGFSDEFVPPRLLFRVVQTAGLYLVPIKSYSKTTHGSSILKWTIVSSIFYCPSSKSTITDKRTSLGAEKVNKLLFLKKNLKLLKEIGEPSVNKSFGN